MNYSKIHQQFAERIYDNKVLEYPEQYLGLNYETVLNYWWYLESLSEFANFGDAHYRSRPYDYVSFLMREAKVLAPQQAEAWTSTQLAFNICEWYGWATVELICMHRILDEGKSLFYLPKIFNE